MRTLAWKDARECGVGSLGCRVETRLDAWVSREKRVGTSANTARTSACATIAAFIMLAGAVRAGAEESVTAVRFWSLADITRIAVETSGQFEFRWDRLSNPDRIFFDLPGTHPELGHKTLNVIPVGDQFVRQIRVAETQRG